MIEGALMKFPLFKVHVDTNSALQGIEEVLRSGFLNEGAQVKALEKEVASALNADNLLLVNSCTSALSLAYYISGVKSGREVISTPMTCIASNTPIYTMGGKIVWVDVDKYSGNIDPAQIENKITRDTVAVLSVSWGGSPPDLEAIDLLTKKHGITHIHDAAHAFGATLKGRPISDFADFTCYSFQAIKHFTCGDGGALVCREQDKFQLAKKLKWFGYDRDDNKDENGEWKGQRWSADVLPNEVGFKFNMNNVAAAIGLSQIPLIKGILAKHRANAQVYKDLFSKSEYIKPAEQTSDCLSSFWVYTILIDEPHIDRDLLLDGLNSAGIGAGLVHVANNHYSAFKEFEEPLPGTAFFGERQISLPCGWWLSNDDCRIIGETLLSLIKDQAIA